MLDLLESFVGELRKAGLPVSLTEAVDAGNALHHIDFDDREAFKYSLGTTLVKNQAHWKSFETVFEVYFARGGQPVGSDEEGGADERALEAALARARLAGMDELGTGAGGEPLTPEEIAAMLRRALIAGDEEWTRALARIAVSRFAGMEPGRPVGGVYYLYRTLRNLNLDALMESIIAEERGAAPGGLSPMEERLFHDELAHRVDALRKEIEAEIRRRLVADRGPEAMARSLRKPLPEEIDFMHANRDELAQIRRTVQPLSRKLAVRLARRRRHLRRGSLDFRSTIRHSLSYGGVPAEPRFRKPRPSKPEIVILADISGSVASFARFTLHLVHALNGQFSKIRSFVFVDGVDEVTRLFEGADDIGEAVHRVNTEADVVWVDGHSDYGHVFEVFWERWGEEMTPKSSVIVLGDARNNYHASNAWVLEELHKRVRHLYWLDPEPRAYWDTGDSIVGTYGRHCDGVFECRNLKQLEKFVDFLT